MMLSAESKISLKSAGMKKEKGKRQKKETIGVD